MSYSKTMVSNPFRRSRSSGRFSFSKSFKFLLLGAMLLNAFVMYASDKSDTSSKSSTSDKKWVSSKSAVLGLATGYSLNVYKQFVGSLRTTGYSGHIILGIAADASSDVHDYFKEQNVTVQVVEMADSCTYDKTVDNNGKIIGIDTKKWHCAKAYPDYKITWGRFALYKDWLHECPDCTDGVILTDVRDAYFQRDPFETETQLQHSLMMFEEIEGLTNTHWLTDFPVTSCKNHTVGETPMLCSGSVMGSRKGILDYIDVMMEEFDDWKTKEKCRIDLVGDDQSIHNYLYYTNRFKNAIAIPHRTGPIHVVGYQAARIYENATAEAKEKGIDLNNSPNFYIKNESKWQEWLPEEYGLLDKKTGLIVNKNGSPSAQVHQVDRFGAIQQFWLKKMDEQNWPYNN